MEARDLASGASATTRPELSLDERLRALTEGVTTVEINNLR
jgi:hypothetical protein